MTMSNTSTHDHSDEEFPIHQAEPQPSLKDRAQYFSVVTLSKEVSANYNIVIKP